MALKEGEELEAHAAHSDKDIHIAKESFQMEKIRGFFTGGAYA